MGQNGVEVDGGSIFGVFDDEPVKIEVSPGKIRIVFEDYTRVYFPQTPTPQGVWKLSCGTIIDEYADILMGDYIEGYIPEGAFEEVFFYKALPQNHHIRKRKTVVAVGTKEPQQLPT